MAGYRVMSVDARQPSNTSEKSLSDWSRNDVVDFFVATLGLSAGFRKEICAMVGNYGLTGRKMERMDQQEFRRIGMNEKWAEQVGTRLHEIREIEKQCSRRSSQSDTPTLTVRLDKWRKEDFELEEPLIPTEKRPNTSPVVSNEHKVKFSEQHPIKRKHCSLRIPTYRYVNVKCGCRQSHWRPRKPAEPSVKKGWWSFALTSIMNIFNKVK